MNVRGARPSREPTAGSWCLTCRWASHRHRVSRVRLGAHDPERELAIDDRRGCGEADFTVLAIAGAFGVVVDWSGRSLPGVDVDAVAAELAGFTPAASDATLIDLKPGDRKDLGVLRLPER